MKRAYYWDKASEEIWKLFKKTFEKDMHICEIGCGGGHFLHKMYVEGYHKLTGVEVREERLKQTKDNFNANDIRVNLIHANVLDVNEKYDAIFSTGLIQCMDSENRDKIIVQMSKMAPLALFTVPEIVNERNINSKEKTAVSGCPEFSTGNLDWELSKYYKEIHCGRIPKEKLGVSDDFLYYICWNK